MKARAIVIGVICGSLLLSGCGAMFNGSSKVIEVQGSPEGAKISGNPDIGSYTLPASLSLSRKNSYVLTFSKEGYKDAKVNIKASAQFGIIVLDVLLTGLIGVVVDAATGSWNGLSPDQVSVSLEKADMSVIGPERIEITIDTNGRDDIEIAADSESGIVVQVTNTK